MKNSSVLSLTLCVVLLSLWCGVSLAADDSRAGLLAGLPKLKDFTAKRQSSFDPSGGNADGRQDMPLQPGETRDMAVIEGPGAVTHIWITIASNDKNHLKNLVLRMYWDGEESPSVECPVGDFFGLGHGRYYQYDCLPIQIGTNNGLNCFWYMPFGNGARITVTNDGPVEVGAFYYYVDYQVYKKAPENEGRFHAQYSQEYPCTPGQNYVFFEAEGRGHYVGCNLSIHNRAAGWWGEGDDMIYIDGEETPSFQGTGSEDYFCGAWCYGPEFSNQYIGCPLIDGRHETGAHWNVYRYHLSDPIPFTKSIKMTIEHGHANDRNDDFSSVAYWYQTEPHAPFPALPAADQRLPEKAEAYWEEGAIELETMIDMVQGEPKETQGLGGFQGTWSGGTHLWFKPQEPAVYTALVPVTGPEARPMQMKLWYTAAPDYGICELWVNGEKAGEWNGYNAEGVQRDAVEFPLALKDGENKFELRVTGKDPDSSGYFAGIDCIRLSPR